MIMTPAALALTLIWSADSSPSPPASAAAARPQAQEQPFKRIEVGFRTLPAATPGKRTDARQAEANRQYAPLILITHPDGTRSVRHGPMQSVEPAVGEDRPR